MKMADAKPRTIAMQIGVGFLLHYIIGGGLLGTIGTILGLVGLGNASYFVYQNLKGRKFIGKMFLKTLIAIGSFLLFLSIYASLGLIVSSM